MSFRVALEGMACPAAKGTLTRFRDWMVTGEKAMLSMPSSYRKSIEEVEFMEERQPMLVLYHG